VPTSDPADLGPEFFRAVVERAPDAVFLADGLGRYLYVNEAACRLSGYPREELLALGVGDLSWGPDPVQQEEHLARVRAEGTASGEYPFRHRDGSQRWWRIDAFRILGERFVAIVRDVTAVRATAEALERERIRLHRAQDLAAVGWWEFDLEQGTVDASDVTRRIYGIPDGDELSIAAVQEIPLRRYRATLDAALEALIQRQEPYEQEFEIQRPDDGAIRTILSRAEHDPAQRRVFGVLQDITPLRRTEAALRESEDRLRQAQKMEAVGRLAGGVAHDFNNLLTPILGFAELVQQDLPEDDPHQEDLTTVVRAAERARDLTGQLLAFGRKQMLEMRTLDLNQVIAESEAMLRRLVREDIRLQTVLDADLGAVRADLSQIHNVLINLVVNAADAMPDGGDLTIETTNVSLDGAYADAHPGSRSGPHVMLAVSDTGQGMDPQTLAMIFEPFFTTKGVEQGIGLGLATVHGIVKQHGGSIYAYSEPGRGSIFKVYLPLAEGVAEDLPAEEVARELGGSERILVVEDDAAVRGLAEVVLQKFGYEVIAAADADAAVALARSGAEPCALLLTDVVMPGMNGAQLHRQLVASWPDLPVLFMSGYTANVIAHHGILAEGVHFLSKPFTPRSLAARVREVLDG